MSRFKFHALRRRSETFLLKSEVTELSNMFLFIPYTIKVTNVLQWTVLNTLAVNGRHMLLRTS